MNNRKISHSQLIILVLSLSTVSCFYYTGDKLLKPEQSFDARITHIQEYKGWVYINDSVAIDGNNVKYYGKAKFLNRLIQVGDSVSTLAFNDSIYLFKPNGKVYSFLKNSSSRKNSK